MTLELSDDIDGVDDLSEVSVGNSKISINFNELVRFFGMDLKCERSEAECFARDKIRKMALELCDGDSSRLDGDGVPIDYREFLKLERALTKFLEENVGFEPAVILVLGGMFRIVEDRRNLGRIVDNLDPNDPVIGHHVRGLEFFAESLGITTADMTYGFEGAISFDQRALIFRKCFEIVREAVLEIGVDIYDILRMKFKNKGIFKNISGGEILNNDPAQFTEDYIRRDKGGMAFYQFLPRVWVEEVLLLLRNPELVEGIVSSEKKAFSNVYAAANYLHNAKFPVSRTDEIDYLRANLELDETELKELVDVFSSMNSDGWRAVGMIPHSERFEYINYVKGFLTQFFGASERPYQLRSLLTKVVARILRFDQAYRESSSTAIRKGSLISTEAGFRSTSIALSSLQSFKEKFEPVTRAIGGCVLRIEAVKIGRNEYLPALKLMSLAPLKIIFQNLSLEDFEEAIAFGNLEMSREQINVTRELFVSVASSLKAKKKRLVDFDDVDEMYAYYSLIRYAFLQLPKLYPGLFEEHSRGEITDEIAGEIDGV